MKQKFGSRQEWLAGRRQGIGASEWAEILRDHLPEDARELLYSSPYKLWCEKTGLKPPDDLTGVERIEWGLRHEPTIAQAVMDKTGRQIVLSEEFTNYRADDCNFLMASPDAFQKKPGRDDPGVLQIKTCDFFMKRHWRDEDGVPGPPLPVKIQVLAEMRVTGCKWGSAVVLVSGNTLLGPFDFERNDVWLDKAEAELKKFWDMVVTGTPPPIDESEATFELIKDLYPEAKAGSSIHLGEEFVDVVAELQAQAKIRLAAKKKEDGLKAKLAAAMGENAIAYLPDGSAVFYPTIQRSGYTVQPSSYRQFKFK